jgi:hypothetical protein
MEGGPPKDAQSAISPLNLSQVGGALGALVSSGKIF